MITKLPVTLSHTSQSHATTVHATTNVTDHCLLTRKTTAQTQGTVCTILLYRMAMGEVFLTGF
jgi:hypothetical protein